MVDLEELRKHEFILLCYEHYNGLGLVRSLGINKIKPIVFILKRPFKMIRASKYVKKYYEVDNYEQALEIMMKEYSNLPNKPFVYPVDDDSMELIDKNYDELSKHFILHGVGKSGGLKKYFSKLELCKVAEQCGVPYAKTWCVKPGNIPSDIIYPVITKPLTSYVGWKSDYYICKNEEDLKDAYSKLTRKEDDILLQQFIEKDNELCLDGLSVNKGKDVLITIQSKYTYLLPDYYSMEMVVSNFKNEELYTKIKKMFEIIGFEGIFSIEFLIDKQGNLYFLEINFRNSTWSWASTKLGMNLPIIWADSMLQGKLREDFIKEIPNNYIALAENADYQNRVVRLKMISRWRWFRGVLRANCLFDYYWKDPKPTFLNYYYRVAIKLSRIFKRKKNK